MVQWLKKWLPKPEFFYRRLAHHPRLAKLLSDPNIWRLNRRSATRGVAVGLGIAFIPIPLQLVLSALTAVLCRAYLPLALILSMINNPFTFVPINYFIYQLGVQVLQREFRGQDFTHFTWHLETLHSTWTSLLFWLPQFGKAYFLGLGIVIVSAPLLGYLLTDICWRIDLSRRLYRRNKRRQMT